MRSVIQRKGHLQRLRNLLRTYPVVGILGARQVGKTTLARQLAAEGSRPAHHFDLEDPRDLARLADPMLVLPDLRGLVVLDEIQRRPDLFPALRVLADRPRRPARFLVLGSASPDLLRHGSETLAGRIHYHRLDGLGPGEVGSASARRLWLRGGFPRSFLARTSRESLDWRLALIERFLQRDLPQLGIRIAGETLRSFWSMLAHYHGQTWNAAEVARSLGVSQPTAGRYLDLLAHTFVVRKLRPWHENLKKRQVKSPKVYLEDTGILHALLNLPRQRDLDGHPKVGASWEWFALRTVVARLGARWDECHFWATHQGAELDLLVVRGRRRWGFEFKRSSAPSMTASMRIALCDLGLHSLDVVHAGSRTYRMSRDVRAVALDDVEAEIASLP
jgi:hypothetical protein